MPDRSACSVVPDVLDVEGLDNKHARGKEKGDEIESTKGGSRS